jgi:hypothetical protein
VINKIILNNGFTKTAAQVACNQRYPKCNKQCTAVNGKNAVPCKILAPEFKRKNYRSWTVSDRAIAIKIIQQTGQSLVFLNTLNDKEIFTLLYSVCY